MTATIFLLLGGLMGAGGIILAAAGAHAAAAAATSGSAGYMLLFHAAAVVGGAALLQQHGVAWRPLLIAALAGWVLGATLFSADLALRAFTGHRLFAMAAPTGGIILIAAWLALAGAALGALWRGQQPKLRRHGCCAPGTGMIGNGAQAAEDAEEKAMRARAIILAGAFALSAVLPAAAQQTIKIGELNSYKAQPAFLDPYKKGWEMAIDEINSAGGVLGKKLEIVSRDDGANPGDAVRVAEELTTGEGVNILCGTFLSNVGLAVTEFAGKKKVFFLAAEPLTDKITWQNGNRYTFRLRPSTYMQVAMLLPDALAAKTKRWALVYPNFEYGQSAAAAFKELMKARQPDVEFVTEQAPPLGKIDAGAVVQAIDDAKPGGIFSALFAGYLIKFVREGTTRGIFKDRVVVDLLGGEPEYLDPLKDEAPAGWIVTGYPWNEVATPENKAFVAAYEKRYHDYPRMGSIVGYLTIKSLAAGIAKAGSTDTEKLVDAFRGLKLDGPFGPFEFRASDHQATLGAFVGKIALKDGRGTMADFKYVDGASVLPSDAEVKKLRPAAD